MARQSLSPMKHVDFSDVASREIKTGERVGRKRKDAPMTHLKYLRKRCGYTLETLSEITNISISYLSRLESGSRRLNTDLIKRLSHAFNCDPSELLQEVSHDSRIVAPIEFSRRRTSSVREQGVPMYCISVDSENGDCKINVDTPLDWVSRPSELESKTEAFAIKADCHFKPAFSESSMLYLEPANGLSPESTVVVSDGKNVLLRKVWSITPTTLQLCEVKDMEALKSGAASKDKLQEIDRASLGAIYKVIGYSDFNI